MLIFAALRVVPGPSAAGEDRAAEDARLAAAAAGGDRGAFAELYRRHAERIHARLTRLCGPVPEREDLLQQTFLELHRALPRFRGEASLSTYLHKIAIRVAYDHLAARRRRPVALLDDGMLDELIAPGAGPEEAARQREDLARAFTHLAALKPKKRVAFVLVAIEGLSLDDAAELVGANAQAVKQRVLAARHELAERIAREERRAGGAA